jgi:Leucine-rich repeat (LRR) protein
MLTKIPIIPTLLYLDCKNNMITEMPEFDDIIYINCSFNQLSKLPKYKKIEKLTTNDNIKKLPFNKSFSKKSMMTQFTDVLEYIPYLLPYYHAQHVL